MTDSSPWSMRATPTHHHQSDPKYRLRRGSRKERCPQCHQRTFTPYTLHGDKDGPWVHEGCGRCDREYNCGYHAPPRDFLTDDHDSPLIWGQPEREPEPVRPVSYIDRAKVDATLKETDLATPLHRYLCAFFSPQFVADTSERLGVGAMKWKGHEWVIYWQIDQDGNARTGKMMLYAEDGHRQKKGPNGERLDGNATFKWAHKLSAAKDEYNLKQVMFGEHQLGRRPPRRVNVVEAEKTAFVMSLFYPTHTWMAIGATHNHNVEMIRRLQNAGVHDVVLFPDSDAFEKWQDYAMAAGCRINDYLNPARSIARGDATPWPEPGVDLADILLEHFEQAGELPPELMDYVFSFDNPKQRK